MTQILATIIKYKNERRFIDSKEAYSMQRCSDPCQEDWVVMRNACDEAVIFSDKIISLLGDVSLSLKVRVLFANNLSQGLDCFLLLHKSKLLMYVDCFKNYHL